MDYSYITGPIIGAIIGYSTNWIAIKMMFRPRKPIKIGRITLPFTPGIIPKNRENIAYAISTAITNNLLTEEDLQTNLLSENMKEKIKDTIDKEIYNNEVTAREWLIANIGNEKYEEIYNKVIMLISTSIFDNIKERELEKIIAEQIKISVEKKMSGSIMGLFGGNKMLQPIIENIEEQTKEYIESNGAKLVQDMVSKEINKYMSIKITKLSNLDIEGIIIDIYERIIANKLPEVLEKINIGKVIENKINAMDIEELEKLILSIMKKELNAIVNLGAVIGFILGLFNLLF